MLQTRKNLVLTSAAIKQMNVRNRELQFYMNSYWVWGSCCTVMEGFVFGQLVTPVPPETELWLEVLYLIFITVCGGLNLYIITVTTLCCVWGPAMAIRGSGGLRSVHKACDFMKEEQNWVYGAFLVSICSYFGFSMCLLLIYGWNSKIAIVCNVIFTGFLIMLLCLLYTLTQTIKGDGSSKIFDHSGDEGRIRTFDILQDLADIDHNVHSRVPDVEPPRFPGMRELFRGPLAEEPSFNESAGSERRAGHLSKREAELSAWDAVEHTPTSEDYATRKRAVTLYALEPGEAVAAAFGSVGDVNPEEAGETTAAERPGAGCPSLLEAENQAPDEASECGWFTRAPSR